MELASAQVIGAGLAAIGAGVAAAGVGNVFGTSSRARCATRPPPTARQGRLFIGFAAAELLGLMAFAVAMIILYAPDRLGGLAAEPARSRRERTDASDRPTCPRLPVAVVLAAADAAA